jgi:hypothetical protein
MERGAARANKTQVWYNQPMLSIFINVILPVFSSRRSD